MIKYQIICDLQIMQGVGLCSRALDIKSYIQLSNHHPLPCWSSKCVQQPPLQPDHSYLSVILELPSPLLIRLEQELQVPYSDRVLSLGMEQGLPVIKSSHQRRHYKPIIALQSSAHTDCHTRWGLVQSLPPIQTNDKWSNETHEPPTCCKKEQDFNSLQCQETMLILSH